MFIQPEETDWHRTLSRSLIIGPPDSGKTYSLKTWPHDEKGYLHVISFPGEKGTNSVPRGEYIKQYIWKQTKEENLDSRNVINQVWQLTVDILSGKYGPVKTIAGDGLHKLVEYHLDVASDGRYFKAEEFEPKLYLKCYASFLSYLNLVSASDTPFVVFTCWDGKEPDSYKGVKSEGGRIYPELPGKLAKKIVGEFSIRMFATRTESPLPGKPAKYKWVLKQDAALGAVGMKLPDHVDIKLPNDIEQDWDKLYTLLKG